MQLAELHTTKALKVCRATFGLVKQTFTFLLIHKNHFVSHVLTLYVHPCSSDSRTPRITSRIALTDALDQRRENKPFGEGGGRRGNVLSPQRFVNRPSNRQYERCITISYMKTLGVRFTVSKIQRRVYSKTLMKTIDSTITNTHSTIYHRGASEATGYVFLAPRCLTVSSTLYGISKNEEGYIVSSQIPPQFVHTMHDFCQNKLGAHFCR